MSTMKLAPYLRPMLCDSLDEIPQTDEWVIEKKLDGWRAQFDVTEDGVRWYTGREEAFERTGTAPLIEEALSFLPPGTTLDGELCATGDWALGANGHGPAVSTALAYGGTDLILVVIDLMRVAGVDVRGEPYMQRREPDKPTRYELLTKAAEGFDTDLVRLTEPKPPIPELHERWLADGYEGSVAKRVDGIYRSNCRSRAWAKIKPQDSITCRVLGFVEGGGEWAGKYGAMRFVILENGCESTCSLGSYDHEGRLLDLVNENPEGYIGRVFDVRHHGMFEGGSVRHPVFDRWRSDLDGGMTNHKEAA